MENATKNQLICEYIWYTVVHSLVTIQTLETSSMRVLLFVISRADLVKLLFLYIFFL